MYRFNRRSALFGEEVVDFANQRVEIARITTSADYPIEDTNNNRYTNEGRMWNFTQEPTVFDLFMRRDPYHEEKKENKTTKPEDRKKDKVEKKEDIQIPTPPKRNF